MIGRTRCEDITPTDLAGITGFSFSYFTSFGGNVRDDLKSGDFAGLTGLTKIGLGSHQLTTLPDDIFSGLSALTELSLDDNQLSSLPTGIFAGLTSLTTLNLSGNSLPTSLPASLFSDVPRNAITLPTGTTINAAVPTTVGTIANITDLVESGSPQTVDVADKFSDTGDTLTYTVESNNTATVTVAVSGSTVTITPVAIGTATITVTATDTADQTATQTLMVRVNAQEADPTDLCSRSQGVRDEIVLAVIGRTRCEDITPTDLAGITGFSFSYFTSFGGNVRDDLKSGDFAGLTGLTKIGLGSHQLTTLPDDIFSGLSALTELSLDDNQLSSLPTGIFAGLTSLTTLNLSGNSLPTSLPASLFSDVPRNAITLPTGTTINAAVPTTVGTIADIDLVENGSPQTVDVANKFSDTGDTLTYTVESNNTATATVEVSGSTVTITPVAIGTATITITAADTAGQTAIQTFVVTVGGDAATVTDTTPPTITLLGSATLSIAFGTAYTDAGATASDNIDGNITASITTTITFAGNTVGAVNPNTAGVYTIAYNVSDTAGNPATPVTRTVTVMAAVAVTDTTPPTITLLGSATLSIAFGTAYTDAGATASDNIDGNITASITTTITFAGNTVGAVNPNTAGVYTIAYNVSDTAGNQATPVTRTVTVMPAAVVTDITPPTITLLGSATLFIASGTAYTNGSID